MDKIKVFIMDVDGTMTDGNIYMAATGEMFKSFDIKDGYGIHEILPENGVTTVIMTGRVSDIVLNRAKELEISIVLQNVKDKGKAILKLQNELRCRKEEMAYIGDDIIDISAMVQSGIAACPKNAVQEVKDICQYVCKNNGGNGAIREFIEWLKLNDMLIGGQGNEN